MHVNQKKNQLYSRVYGDYILYKKVNKKIIMFECKIIIFFIFLFIINCKNKLVFILN